MEDLNQSDDSTEKAIINSDSNSESNLDITNKTFFMGNIY